MATIGVLEARARFAQLLRRTECGEEIVVTRRGKAVARLVPATAKPDKEAAMAAFRRLREHARRSGLGKLDWAEWRSYRDKGGQL
jgi:prevent-host-death family protein